MNSALVPRAVSVQYLIIRPEIEMMYECFTRNASGYGASFAEQQAFYYEPSLDPLVPKSEWWIDAS